MANKRDNLHIQLINCSRQERGSVVYGYGWIGAAQGIKPVKEAGRLAACSYRRSFVLFA
jgi:hypothetical protein